MVAVDAHPGYRATQAGHAMGLPVTEVWHHHAHLAACLAENGWPLDGGPVAGIVLDGTGLGPDGTLWGGEVLLGDYRGFARATWLRPAPLIGGDRAAREPWRNALARLDQAGLADWADALFPAAPRDLLRQAAARAINAPLSSSVGRLFDAFAAVLGICPDAQTYEGEAAMRLEALARDADSGLPFARASAVIDPAPIWASVQRALHAGESSAALAGRFHVGLARAFAEAARDLVARGEARAVALSGGCFQNARLVQLILRMLGDIPVLTHRTTPANDGGLALGQVMVAAARALGGAESPLPPDCKAG
jgi:hydrogenase maturation protein HypF